MLVYLLGIVVFSTLCYLSINSGYCLRLRYNEVDDIYQYFAIDTTSGEAVATYYLKPSYN